MGTELTAQCSCGAENNVYIGSSRAMHGKIFDFPHYCASCRSVITIDKLSGDIRCGVCGSTDVHSYEMPTKTLGVFSFFNRYSPELLRFFGYHKHEEVFHESFCYVLKKSFPIKHGTHYCPKCGENKMKFFVSLLYD